MEGSCSSEVVLKKGTWTPEEDILLKKCIDKFGPGKWHLVPSRAGLNRCRKSCRLRWMNYLKPDIKRGEFSADEIDLILRLHKLLGNRWSLIAGRIPGRTANDVKNYWNTYLKRKTLSHAHGKINVSSNKYNNGNDIHQREKNTKSDMIIKPRPQAFKQQFLWLVSNDNNPDEPIGNDMNYLSSSDHNNQVSTVNDTKCWWESLLELDCPSDEGMIKNSFLSSYEFDVSGPSFQVANVLTEDAELPVLGIPSPNNNNNNVVDDVSDITSSGNDGPTNCWTDFEVDLDLWNHTSKDGK